MSDYHESYKKCVNPDKYELDLIQWWMKNLHDWNTKAGWWPFTRKDRDGAVEHAEGNRFTTAIDPFYYIVMEKLALIHSEVTEGIEEWRRGKPLMYEVETTGDRGMMEMTAKPEGLVVELADTVIRIFDLVHALDPEIDFDAVIRWKQNYNMRRPPRHGGLKG